MAVARPSRHRPDVAGAVAILVPAVSEIAASKVLGSVLIVSGLVQIMQSAKMLRWMRFIWHLLLGILAASAAR